MNYDNRIQKTETCWLWTGAKSTAGYGVVRVGSKLKRAHRVVYEQEVGAIPFDKVCDHICRVRHCVNPAHIELVSNAVNVMRGRSNAAQNARKKSCIHGHRFSAANTYTNSRGWRVCKECKRAWMKKKRANA